MASRRIFSPFEGRADDRLRRCDYATAVLPEPPPGEREIAQAASPPGLPAFGLSVRRGIVCDVFRCLLFFRGRFRVLATFFGAATTRRVGEKMFAGLCLGCAASLFLCAWGCATGSGSGDEQNSHNHNWNSWNSNGNDSNHNNGNTNENTNLNINENTNGNTTDTDGDGVCDSLDVCPGFDDSIDTDGDGTPDGCDPCPLDDPDDTDGDGVCDSLDVCPGFDDTEDANGNGVPDGCEGQPGSYVYERLPIGGLEESVAVAFHPSGDYFVVLERSDRVHIYDVASATVSTAALGSGIYWEDIEFAPSGAYALLTGRDTGTDEGVVFRLDHAVWEASAPSTTGVFSEYVSLLSVGSYASVLFRRSGGLPVLLGRSSDWPYTMHLLELGPDTGDATILAASATGAGCQDLADVRNEWGDPGILVVCGINGYDALYLTEVGGVSELRTDLGNNGLGNTARAAAHPSGDYALVISWSGDAVYRFEGGQMCSYSEAVHFSTRRLWTVGFATDGGRALIIGRKMNISGDEFGTVIEFRHDHFVCPQPLTVNCDLTEVSIPDFGSPPWIAPDNTDMADVAYRPGCDGGVIVGGYSSWSTDYGFVATFQLAGGHACW
jgi:hypothetical protein